MKKILKKVSKNLDNKNWNIYPDKGVATKGVSCLEFKVVRYYNSTDPEKTEEMWDYEDLKDMADHFHQAHLPLPMPLPQDTALMTRVHDAMFRSQILRLQGEEGDAEKAIEILETLEEKYDKPKHWTHEQTNRLSDAIEDLNDEMSSRDREKHSKDIYEVYRDILENLD